MLLFVYLIKVAFLLPHDIRHSHFTFFQEAACLILKSNVLQIFSHFLTSAMPHEWTTPGLAHYVP